MEQPKYYELEGNNWYCVHFANKQGLTIEEIKDIFEEWGNVVNVTKAGDDYGYRFVKYKHEIEVKRCVEALKNHRTIRLLPKKPRKFNNDRNNGQNSNNSTSKHNQEIFSKGSKNSLNNFTNNEKRNEGNNEDYLSPNNSSATFENNETLNHEFSMNKNIPAFETKNFSSEVETKNCTQNSQNLDEKIFASDNLEIDIQKNEDSRTLVDENLPPLVEIRSDANPATKIRDEIPALVLPIHSRMGKNIVRGDLSEKLLKNEIFPPQRIVNAEEIVVGNLPTDCSENLILHIFRNYEPLSISPIKIIRSIDVRFCVVFFPTVNHAEMVQNIFDNHPLGGNNLIVLRLKNDGKNIKAFNYDNRFSQFC